MLKVENVSGGYGDRQIVHDVSFHIQKGQMYGILGPNGSGKSTLMKLVSGILVPSAGQIWVDDKKMESYSAKNLAKKMAVLPQLLANAFSNTVYDTVSLGRYPYQKGLFSSWSKEDEQAVLQAMEQTGIARYKDAYMASLSGGEQQRVFIAQALAQQSPLLLLDEPTNHLDIAHQKQILDLIKKQSVEQGVTVLAVFHDINLASLYCDQLILMEQGTIKVIGEPHEVVLQHQIVDVYDAEVTTYAHPELPKPQITMMPAMSIDAPYTIRAEQIQITSQAVKLVSDVPLKIVSSAVHNAGAGWYDTLLNRFVPGEYDIANVKEETVHFLQEHRYSLTNTVVMMTAVSSELAVVRTFTQGDLSLVIMVTAGVGNAVDVTRTFERDEEPHVGTINTWVLINGKLSDEAFFQAMMTATEAKTKALADEQVKDSVTQTIATSTGTDSLLIGATQLGEERPYAGPITDVGKLIGHGVYESTRQAIRNYYVSIGHS